MLQLLCLALLPHSFHVSLTEMEYNAEAKAVEVMICIFSDDLEQALAKHTGRRIILDRTEDAEQRVVAYLKTVFQLKDKSKVIQMTWLGMEVGVKKSWLYFSFQTDRLKGCQLRNTLLSELFHDQLNTVNFAEAGQRGSLIFKAGEDFKAIDLGKK